MVVIKLYTEKDHYLFEPFFRMQRSTSTDFLPFREGRYVILTYRSERLLVFSTYDLRIPSLAHSVLNLGRSRRLVYLLNRLSQNFKSDCKSFNGGVSPVFSCLYPLLRDKLRVGPNFTLIEVESDGFLPEKRDEDSLNFNISLEENVFLQRYVDNKNKLIIKMPYLDDSVIIFSKKVNFYVQVFLEFFKSTPFYVGNYITSVPFFNDSVINLLLKFHSADLRSSSILRDLWLNSKECKLIELELFYWSNKPGFLSYYEQTVSLKQLQHLKSTMSSIYQRRWGTVPSSFTDFPKSYPEFFRSY